MERYLLSATGEDRQGIVCAVTEVLFKRGCNLQDSSMMRLGSEFGIFLIFTTPDHVGYEKWKTIFSPIARNFRLTLNVKKLTRFQAQFVAPKKDLYIATVHGRDRAGIVYQVTTLLFQHKFNITDVFTHRTEQKGNAGYVLFIEGELLNRKLLTSLERSLSRLSRKLKVHVSFKPILHQSL